MRDGKRTPDYSHIYDIKYGIRRTDGSDSLYFCPKNRATAFFNLVTCDKCPFKIHLDSSFYPYEIGCSFRFEKMDWGADCAILEFKRREDGFIESITMANPDGEARLIEIKNPKTFLRALLDLWDKYKPLKYLSAFNAKNGRIYSVFNPGWQKYKNGVVKGRPVSPSGKLMSSEEIVPNVEEPVWFVVDTVKKSED